MSFCNWTTDRLKENHLRVGYVLKMSVQGEELPRPRLPWNVYGYALTASFSSFVYGYNTGMIAPAIIFIPQTMPLSVLETSAIVSIILAGAIVGSFFSGLLADAFGRRRVLAWNNALMLIAAVTAALGEHSYYLMISRFVLGLGVGIASVVPGLYITEIAPSHVRGKLGAINQLNGWTGIIVSYFVGYEVVVCTAGDLCWRYMFASGAVLCIFHWILTMAVLSETPRWLISQGRSSEALSVLIRIYGDTHEAHIMRQYQVLAERRDHHEPACLSCSEIFDRRYRKPLFVAFVMQLLQQASGNSAIVYYSTMVFHSLGFSRRDALFYNAIACVPQFVVLVAVVFTLDKHGRRPSLLISELGITLSLLAIGMATTIDSRNDQFWLLLAGVVLHRAFFAGGLGPVPTVLVAETLPFAIRGRGLAVSLALNWLANFVVTATFPILMREAEPAHVYWGFAACTLFGFFFVAMFVNETKGVSLEKIEERGLDQGRGREGDEERGRGDRSHDFTHPLDPEEGNRPPLMVTVPESGLR